VLEAYGHLSNPWLSLVSRSIDIPPHKHRSQGSTLPSIHLSSPHFPSTIASNPPVAVYTPHIFHSDAYSGAPFAFSLLESGEFELGFGGLFKLELEHFMRYWAARVLRRENAKRD